MFGSIKWGSDGHESHDLGQHWMHFDGIKTLVLPSFDQTKVLTEPRILPIISIEGRGAHWPVSGVEVGGRKTTCQPDVPLGLLLFVLIHRDDVGLAAPLPDFFHYDDRAIVPLFAVDESR